MAKKHILMDGATGSCLWEKTENKLPVWRYNIENPAIVSELHREYIDAGCDIILSNTFCANSASVKGVEYSAADAVREGVRLAKAAKAEAARGILVGLDIGPLTGLLKPFGDISQGECSALYHEQIGAGMAEKPDIIMLETFMDIEMLKLALIEALKFDVPVFASMSFTKFGKTIMGNSVKKIVAALAEYPVAAMGLNCSTGPDIALPVIKQFAEETNKPLIFKPNAGMPTEEGQEFDIDAFVSDMLPAAAIGIEYLGGCCGTSPAYIKRLGEKLL